MGVNTEWIIEVCVPMCACAPFTGESSSLFVGVVCRGQQSSDLPAAFSTVQVLQPKSPSLTLTTANTASMHISPLPQVLYSSDIPCDRRRAVALAQDAAR